MHACMHTYIYACSLSGGDPASSDTSTSTIYINTNIHACTYLLPPAYRSADEDRRGQPAGEGGE